MAFVSVSGEAGTTAEQVARAAAVRLGFLLINETELRHMVAAEFPGVELASKAWHLVAQAVVAKAGLQCHVIVSTVRSERIIGRLPDALKVHILSYGSRSTDQRRKTSNGSTDRRAFDLMLNAGCLSDEQMVDLIDCAIKGKGMNRAGLLTPSLEAKVQFEVRLKLAKFGIAAPDRIAAKKDDFGHPSEQVFANLLDFYRIEWKYEPRSFPLQWDQDGKVSEAFTPDFYLPEFDVYVELTTMKQANVTKKNRKIRLLRAIYPHVNIQVFYKKDVEDLVIKYGLPERFAR